jgi:tight adherence protein C
MPAVPTSLVYALVTVFVATGLLAGLAAFALSTRKAPERRRLEALVTGGVITPTAGSLEIGPSRGAGGVGSLVPRSASNMSRLQRRLATAGYRGASAATIFTPSEIVLPVLAAGIALLSLGAQARMGWIVAAVVAAVAYFVPGLIVERKMTLRKKQIRNGLADVVDLVIICLEAGSSLDQAVVKATDDLEIAYPFLADELRTLSTETRAGKTRIEAFKNLAQRTGVDEVRELVAMLVQTDRFGTSVAQALRIFAKTSRDKRRQRAEETAAKVGVKLVFPLVFLLFPAFYVVTLGPAVIQFVRVFFGQVMQGR